MNFYEIKKVADKEWRELVEGNVPCVFVGSATCGCSAGSARTIKTLKYLIKQNNIDCKVVEVGCIGMCYAEPLVYIKKPQLSGVLYGGVTEEKIQDIPGSPSTP